MKFYVILNKKRENLYINKLFLRWITVKFFGDPDFKAMFDDIKQTLLAALKCYDDDISLVVKNNVSITFPLAWQKMKECNINGQEWGAGFVARRCKVE